MVSFAFQKVHYSTSSSINDKLIRVSLSKPFQDGNTPGENKSRIDLDGDKGSGLASSVEEDIQQDPLALVAATLIGSLLGLGLHLTPFAGAPKNNFLLTVILHWAFWTLTTPPFALAFAHSITFAPCDPLMCPA